MIKRDPRRFRPVFGATGAIAGVEPGRDITRPFIQPITPPEDGLVITRGGHDWRIYDELLQDDRCYSSLTQRITAVVSQPWAVEPGADDAASVAAADWLRDNLAAIRWDRISEKMLFGLWYGFAVGEIMWTLKDGKAWMADIVVPNRRRFRFDAQQRLRLLTTTNMTTGELLPDRKFWTFSVGATHDHDPYGRGLAYYCFWPVFFKRGSLSAWSNFLDRFGSPTVMAKHNPAASRDDVAKALEVAEAISSSGAVAAPSTLEVSLLESARAGNVDFKSHYTTMDEAILRIIRTQTMTSDAGSSRAQAEVHERAGEALDKTDADLLCESFNRGPVRWMTEFNFAGATPPRVYRNMEKAEDLNRLAERDSKLHALGWERTDEGFTEAYGDGYQRRQATAPEGPTALKAGAKTPPEGQEAPEDFAADTPRPLYVSRPVVNGAELLAWAKAQGFTEAELVPADKLHVTIAYSRKPVDWLDMPAAWAQDDDGTMTVPPGGARLVDTLGDAGAVVLGFNDGRLQSRHREIIHCGASWDHEGYRPHITLAYGGAGVDLAQVEPYQGPIVLGPERWEPLNEGWAADLAADPEPDPVAGLVDLFGPSAAAPLTRLVGAIVEAGATAADPETARIRMLEAVEKADVSEFATVLGRGAIAARFAGRNGREVE